MLTLIIGKSEIVLIGEVGNLNALVCTFYCKVGSLPMTNLDMPLGPI